MLENKKKKIDVVRNLFAVEIPLERKKDAEVYSSYYCEIKRGNCERVNLVHCD